MPPEVVFEGPELREGFGAAPPPLDVCGESA